MDLNRVLHMVGGEGGNSYANNSLLQKLASDKAKSMVEEAITKIYTATVPSRIVVADLGCSSGPNTLLTMSEIIKTIFNCSSQLRSTTSTEVQFFLNDLPGNDFNTVFRSIPTFLTDIKREINNGGANSIMPFFIAGVPGSYFERLFFKRSLHFVHSSYSLHFLSQVPKLLQSKSGDPSLNRRNIYLAKTSPIEVIDSYREQFLKDFSMFLSLRSEELVDGGRMVLLLLGRQSKDPTDGDCCYLWGSIAAALEDMVSEGLIDESDLGGFNLPFYSPHIDEIREAVLQCEGSFSIEHERIFELHWDPTQDLGNDARNKEMVGFIVAKYIKAIIEPLLKSHFANVDMNEVFLRFAKKVMGLPKEKTIYTNIVITLKKQ